MSFLFPKPKKPDAPPHTPTEADASVKMAGEDANLGYQSLVNTGGLGLKSRASTGKKSLIGGAG